MGPESSDRRGGAIALLLLLILALSGIGTGALIAARRQAVAARTGVRFLQSVLAAESGLRSALVSWPAQVSALASGASVSLPPADLGATGRFVTTFHRVGRELFLVRSEGTPALGPQVHRATAAVWVASPAGRVAGQAAAAVHAAGMSGDGSVVSEDPHAVPPEWEAAICDPWRSTIDSIFPAGVPSERRLETGPDAWTAAGDLRPFDPLPASGGPVGFGFLPLDSLVAVGSPLSDPLGARATRCDDPVAATPPGCARVPVILGAATDRVIGAGSGTGILAVDGDLALTGDVGFAGWVLVSGSLTLREGARVHGLVRAGGRIRVEAPAELVASPCAALEVLGDDWLTRPRPVPGGRQLGPVG